MPHAGEHHRDAALASTHDLQSIAALAALALRERSLTGSGSGRLRVPVMRQRPATEAGLEVTICDQVRRRRTRGLRSPVPGIGCRVGDRRRTHRRSRRGRGRRCLPGARHHHEVTAAEIDVMAGCTRTFPPVRTFRR